ncbi:MAG: hypothetical protein R6V59_06790 [Dehalococcoidia bacterium]
MVDKRLSQHDQLARKTRQERRDKRRAKEKAKLPQHGKSLARVYKDAISKRARAKKADKQSS